MGTEFYTAYMDHASGATDGMYGSKMYLYITSDVNTTVKVEVMDGTFSQTYPVIANNIDTIRIPPSAFLGTKGQFKKGIHITSGKPIAAYAHIFALNASGATLLLPINTLGKDYFSINYTQRSNAINLATYSTYDVIATEDNTTVKLSRPPYIINMNKGDVYQDLYLEDLTGARIQSISNANGDCKKIAVFSGSTRLSIGCYPDTLSSDNFFQQVYPTVSWGENYVTAPLAARNYDVFRIVVSQPGTSGTLNGQSIPLATLMPGQFYEFKSNTPNVVKTDKPAQLVQYAVSQGETEDCIKDINDVGDPEMIYLTPVEQAIDHATLYSAHNYIIQNSYINIVIKRSAVPTFTLDGTRYDVFFAAVPSDYDYAYAQLPVGTGTHTIKAAEGFNAIAYGFGAYESYGYAAGTNLKNLKEFITLKDPVTDSTLLAGCAGTPYKFELTLPYQTTDIKWDFEDGTTYEDKSPVVASTVIKGTQTFYVYEYTQAAKTYTAGDHNIKATVFNPVADGCGSAEDVLFDFNISDPPATAFDATNTCIGDVVQFTDKSATGGTAINTWLWDFGDGQTATTQNPQHAYAKAGDYKVSLLATNTNECSALFFKTVHIGTKPVTAFDFSASDCPGQNITFTDNSTSADGAITNWQWDFGDGTPVETHTTKSPFTHKFNNPGGYLVKLLVTNINGCTSEAGTQTVHINPVPAVDFLMPDVCAGDNARFADKSSIADNTEADFTYLWNFGDDAHATAGNPNTSADQNPVHQFTAAGVYTITLTVTSGYGCVSLKQAQFTVNGTPRAALTVMNPSALCSNQEVFFINNSSVTFGSITRLEVTYDSADPSTLMVYDHPAQGQQLRHSYPVFAGGTRNYTVKVVAYSGVACTDEADYTVVLNAAPIITLTPVKSLCPDDSPVQLSPVVTGPAGSGVFSGTGAINSTGLFDPVKSGVGTFNIRYIYTPLNNCADTVKQQITVYPSPTVDAGQDFTMLAYGDVTFKPLASGHELHYKWIPATGLNHDDIMNPVVSAKETTTYKLIVTSAEGCTASDDVTVYVVTAPMVPNAFTPNGDGINDVWEIKYLNTYPNNTVDVFNRYGQKLYSSVGYNVPWDGKYNGAYVPSGTYYYIINPKNGLKIISGYVTIIR